MKIEEEEEEEETNKQARRVQLVVEIGFSISKRERRCSACKVILLTMMIIYKRRTLSFFLSLPQPRY